MQGYRWVMDDQRPSSGDESAPTTPPTPGDAEIIPFPRVPVGDDGRHGTTTAEREPLLRDVIGDVLREERLRQERTLAEVARRAAVSLPYLSEIERGRKEVSSDVLDAVVRSLDLDLVDVLERAAQRLRVGTDRRGPTVQLRAA